VCLTSFLRVDDMWFAFYFLKNKNTIESRRQVICKLVFNHWRDQKIKLGFFWPKISFFNLFSPKKSNKHPYNLNKLISQLKIPLDWFKTQKKKNKKKLSQPLFTLYNNMKVQKHLNNTLIVKNTLTPSLVIHINKINHLTTFSLFIHFSTTFTFLS
jgi:hypothetical protein